MIFQGGVKELSLNSSTGLPGPTMAERLADSGSFLQFGANITALLGFWTILRQMIPFEYIYCVREWIAPYFDTFNRYAYYEIQENVGQTPNELFDAVQAHLSLTTARTAHRASLIKSKGAEKISYTMSTGSDWTMETFQGHPMWWKFTQMETHSQRAPDYGQPPEEESCSFTLKVEKKNKGKVLDDYMDHIMINARSVKQVNRERQLYTNSVMNWQSRMWTSIPLKHPSSFDTLALDPGVKAEVLDDLQEFARSEAFYKRVGRAWKRGYLLYGPPGTGKSSMIAAMANFLNYDIYDLELTQVASNTELRKLLLQTTSKSIIVIEDIDCSIDLTNRAKEKQKKKDDDSEKKEGKKKKDGVTLSGLLNFTDGIWSCCGSEKIIIFTTNYINKLDPALLRTGRMDMKIHLSYCQFPAFKVLAKNYLGIDHHEMYDQVEEAMQGAHMTPADVAEYLINSSDAETALTNLIAGLERNKLQPLPKEDDGDDGSAAENAGEGDNGGTGTKNAEEAQDTHAQGTKDHGEASAGGHLQEGRVATGTGEPHAQGQKDDVKQEHSESPAGVGNNSKTAGAGTSSESTAAEMLGT